MEIRIPVPGFFHSNEVIKGGEFVPRADIGKGYAVLTEKNPKTLVFSAYAVMIRETGKPLKNGNRQI
jgi:hypothetical protein